MFSKKNKNKQSFDPKRVFNNIGYVASGQNNDVENNLLYVPHKTADIGGNQRSQKANYKKLANFAKKNVIVTDPTDDVYIANNDTQNSYSMAKRKKMCFVKIVKLIRTPCEAAQKVIQCAAQNKTNSKCVAAFNKFHRRLIRQPNLIIDKKGNMLPNTGLGKYIRFQYPVQKKQEENAQLHPGNYEEILNPVVEVGPVNNIINNVDGGGVNADTENEDENEIQV